MTRVKTTRELYQMCYHNERIQHREDYYYLYEHGNRLTEAEYGRRARIQYSAQCTYNNSQPELQAPVTWTQAHNLELNGAIDKNGMITRYYKGYLIIGKVYWADFHKNVPDDFWWVAEIYDPDGTYMTWAQSPAGVAASVVSAARTVESIINPPKPTPPATYELKDDMYALDGDTWIADPNDLVGENVMITQGKNQGWSGMVQRVYLSKNRDGLHARVKISIDDGAQTMYASLDQIAIL